MKIKHMPKQDAFEISISFQGFFNQLEDLHKSNIFFSTYKQGSAVDGFIPLMDSMYVRINIIHKLGAIVKIEDVINKKGFIKMKVDAPKQLIVITIFREAFNGLSAGYFESRAHIRSPLLNDFYIDISLSSSQELIMERWNKKSSPNQNALKKDLIECDNNRFSWSQNTDGGRKRNELLTGNGNNIRHGLKRMRKK
ncbi:hypothetical protein [Psychrobacillus sp. MER TA 171]|uniref:hypothetical protein n=1 Tax=Psychrobacillus sp. MER TA 171 TaxID=2939577 RepID=UPI00203F357E|nr:hypothetical protein [Psychrobacillus sp. MER TA 171]MCM3359234.1 hypothetical protein [Psychrobacillus sp. MER TA 171]